MRLKSIEPTPNPNNMKLNLEEALAPGVRFTYNADSAQRNNYPPVIRRLLQIPGVKGLYHCLDFLALQRIPSADWQTILGQVREILSGEEGVEEKRMGRQGPSAAGSPALPGGTSESSASSAGLRIFVQFFRRIPLLVKVQGPGTPPGPGEEVRTNLPPRFANAVRAATPSAPNMLVERRWVPMENRYGEPKEVGDAVAAEIDAAYPPDRLEALVKQAFEQGAENPDARETRRQYTDAERQALLASEDWKQRYAAVESIGADPAHLATLAAAMKDPHISVRRMATIYLGLLKTPETLAPLVAAMKDPAAVIRRTAGDALNDLAPSGDDRARAIAAMIEAVADKNKLVRWRAARFLYELGDATALPALREAAEKSPEFEVRLQAAQAVERIEGGKEAAGPIWMQMTRQQKP